MDTDRYTHTPFPSTPRLRMTSRCIFSCVFIAAFLSAAAGNFNNECVYTLYVKTGSVIKAGTDSKIGITLGDASGRGRGPCIGAPLCRLNLTSDGSGSHHGWYCDFVEVTSTGPHKQCSKSIFYVEQWLATDAPPFQLTAYLDGCKMWNTPTKQGKPLTFMVGNAKRSASF
ncbi:hypothetical protein L1049_020115 [Liquidambar formosana]|uniref:PLAT domain-containing protein n=1 Tax=Liquidambar formosana TaxID=63359 RepID=A0AAP0SCN6_LIQFO